MLVDKPDPEFAELPESTTWNLKQAVTSETIDVGRDAGNDSALESQFLTAGERILCDLLTCNIAFKLIKNIVGSTKAFIAEEIKVTRV